MAIYVFDFDPRYANQTATVSTMAGIEVSGSPITLDANGDGQLSLAAGAYRAQVSNTNAGFGDGYSAVDGTFDLQLSLAANSLGEWPTVGVAYVGLVGPFDYAEINIPILPSPAVPGLRDYTTGTVTLGPTKKAAGKLLDDLMIAAGIPFTLAYVDLTVRNVDMTETLHAGLTDSIRWTTDMSALDLLASMDTPEIVGTELSIDESGNIVTTNASATYWIQANVQINPEN